MHANGRIVALLASIVLAACSGASGEAPSGEAPRASGDTSTETIGGLTPSAPEALAFDAGGTLYVSEFEGDRIDVVRAGRLEVFAGMGADDPAVDLTAPTGLVFEPNGDLVVADHGNDRIVAIGADGSFARIAGTGANGALGDGGSALHASLDDPIGLAFDEHGDLLIADEQDALIRDVRAKDGTITTLAGGGDDPDLGGVHVATDLALSHPSYVLALPDGDVVFSDFLTNVIWAIDHRGRARVIAGTGDAGYSGDGGAATDADLDFPTGLANRDGVVYVSDANNNAIRAIDLATGMISTVAGTGEPGTDGVGGPATQAELTAPAGLAFGPDGLLYIADQGNDRIVRIDSGGNLQVVVG
jgi:DNA-binding beta-propeller fold protein YncE